MMLGIAFLLVKGAIIIMNQLTAMNQSHNRGIAILTSTPALCIALACASSIRNQIWRSELDFWGDAIKHAPKARGYNNYAIALWELGKAEDAMSYFRKAIEKDDWYAEPHVNLATIYQIRKDNDKAFEHFKRALEIGEGHPELFNNLGMLHFDHQSWDAAENCLKQAIELRPHYSRSHYNLGKLYQVTNRPESAFQCYEQALKGDYQDNDLYYLHGTVCLELGFFDKAAASLEKVGPHYQDTAYLLGCCYYSMPQYAKAAHYFTLACKKDPGNKVCVYNCAQSLLNVRKYDQALDLFEKIKDDTQNFPYAQLHRVKCLYELGKQADAKKSLQALLASKQQSKEVLNDARALQKELKWV
jgi:tetratricopeptide (TPR) repeat protein